jgi:hypothetical protein
MAKKPPRVRRLKGAGKDICLQAASMDLTEVRFLVDHMYRVQKQRKAIEDSVRILKRKGEPHNVIKYVVSNTRCLEEYIILRLLDVATDQYIPARWVRSFDGLDTRMAAGLMGWVDIKKCEYPGQLWSFAGQNPSQRRYRQHEATEIIKYAQEKTGIAPEASGKSLVKIAEFIAVELNRNKESFMRDCLVYSGRAGHITWEGILSTVKKRPWHGMLKQHCHNLAWQLIRYRTEPYRGVYDRRKPYEQELNERGVYKEQAEAALERFNYNRSSVAYSWYKQGKLPPGHLEARAMRHLIKVFLSHYHKVLYYHTYGSEPPRVYILAVGDEKENEVLKEIPCPHWPFGKRK